MAVRHTPSPPVASAPAAPAVISSHTHAHSSVKKDTDFEKLKLIGRGQVGRVYLVRDIHDSKVYAMKVLPKEDMIKFNRVSSFGPQTLCYHNEKYLLFTAGKACSCRT